MIFFLQTSPSVVYEASGPSFEPSKNYNQYGIYGPTWLLPLHKGDKIRIHYSSSNPSSHYYYQFECRVDTPGIFNGKYLGPM